MNPHIQFRKQVTELITLNTKMLTEKKHADLFIHSIKLSRCHWPQQYIYMYYYSLRQHFTFFPEIDDIEPY